MTEPNAKDLPFIFHFLEPSRGNLTIDLNQTHIFYEPSLQGQSRWESRHPSCFCCASED
jgi:hypothetical protein